MPIIRLDPDSPRGKKLQHLQTVYYALISLPLLLFLVFYLQSNQPGYLPPLQTSELIGLHFGVWLLVLAGAFLVLRSYKKRTQAHAGPVTLDDKFKHYISESRRLYLSLVPLMFLPVLAVWATGVIFYGALFSLLVVLVASVRPTVEQFIQSFRLSKEEQAALVEQT